MLLVTFANIFIPYLEKYGNYIFEKLKRNVISLKNGQKLMIFNKIIKNTLFFKTFYSMTFFEGG